MSMTKIDVRVLSAVSAFASKEQARYYLNGVCIEANAQSVTYVATDGHRLACYRHDALLEDDVEPLVGTYIIPTEHCHAFKAKKDADLWAVLASDGERLTLTYRAVDLTFKPIDGVYPDWRRVLPPEDANGKPAQFNPRYLADFWQLSKTLDLSPPFVAHNGEGPAFIKFGSAHEVIGVLMPVQIAGSPTAPVVWDAPRQEQEAA